MFAAALVVFREVLEAALIIGIVAAAARALPHRGRWIAGGLLAGIGGSLLVAASAGEIADFADGVGQELLNATVLGAAVLMLGWHNIWMSRHARELVTRTRAVIQDVGDGRRDLSAIALVIALAVLREGSETALFMWGIASQGASQGGMLLGGVAGLAGGVAVGWLLYAGLLRIPLRWFFSVTSVLVLLLAAGMASQMAGYLQQGGLLPTLGGAVWDSSALLSDHTGPGAVLHILVGYDARPNAMQLFFYLGTLCVIGLGMFLARQPATRTGPGMATQTR